MHTIFIQAHMSLSTLLRKINFLIIRNVQYILACASLIFIQLNVVAAQWEHALHIT